MRKIYPLFLILFTAIFYSFLPAPGSSPGKTASTFSQDTIEFTLRNDFNGDCDKKCYVFLGTQRISRINGQPAGNACNHLFIKCPTGVRLSAGKSYRFLASAFRPNECSTIIDTCNKNLFYELIREIP